MPRPTVKSRLERVGSLALAVSLSTGCALMGLGALLLPPSDRMGGQTTGSPGMPAAESPAAARNVLAPFRLSGVVRVGPAGQPGVVSPLTVSQPLTNSYPLTNSVPLTNSQPLVPVALTNSAPLTSSAPLIGNNSAGLVGNNSAGLRRVASGGERSAAARHEPATLRRESSGGERSAQGWARIVATSDDRVTFVEVIDPATGEPVARVLAGADGRYTANVQLSASASKALIIQATTLVGDKVTAFLAAPLPLAGSLAGPSATGDSGQGTTVSQDVTPGTTVTALALARLAGVREQLAVETGFRGFKTAQLAAMVLLLDREESAKAAEALDAEAAFARAGSFEEVLTEAAAGSAALAQAAANGSAAAGGSLVTLVATSNEILGSLDARKSGASPRPAPGSPVATLVAEAAAGIRAEDVASEAARLAAVVRALTGKSEIGPDDLVSLITVLPATPTPAGTPASGDRPAAGATAGPTPSPTPSTQAAPIASPTPSAIASPAPSPSASASAATMKVSTLAGASGEPGYVDGPLANARFDDPISLCATASTLYVADRDNNRVRAIDLQSLSVSTTAGGPYAGEIPSETPGASGFQEIFGVAVDGAGTVFASDHAIHMVRELAGSDILTFAGVLSSLGLVDGPRDVGTFFNPAGLAYDLAGRRLLVADQGNNAVRAISPAGITSTLAGLGLPFPGLRDGSKAEARFNLPRGVAVAPDGTVYVADTGNHCVRRIATNGQVQTIAGNATQGYVDGPAADARFRAPAALALDSRGDLYIADSGNHAIRRIAGLAGGTPQVATVAGNGAAGFSDGRGALARFRSPQGLAFGPDGKLYVADTGNHCIRALIPE